jgi:hypothetical protein
MMISIQRTTDFSFLVHGERLFWGLAWRTWGTYEAMGLRYCSSGEPLLVRFAWPDPMAGSGSKIDILSQVMCFIVSVYYLTDACPNQNRGVNDRMD